MVFLKISSPHGGAASAPQLWINRTWWIFGVTKINFFFQELPGQDLLFGTLRPTHFQKLRLTDLTEKKPFQKMLDTLDQVAPFIGSSLPYCREVPNSNGVGAAAHLVGLPPARWRTILFPRGRTQLGSCHLAAMLTTTRVRMTTDGSEQTNPFDYLTT